MLFLSSPFSVMADHGNGVKSVIFCETKTAKFVLQKEYNCTLVQLRIELQYIS